MKANSTQPKTIDEYIALFAPEVQRVLKRIRATIKKAAPKAMEKISYQIPAFMQQGVLVYFGAFKKHIGMFPPVRDEKLRREVSAYAGEKGNLQFPLDQPIPYALITKIVKARLKGNQQKATVKATKTKKSRA